LSSQNEKSFLKIKNMTYDALQIKLKNLIDNSPMSAYQVIVVALCFVLNMNDGIDVLVVSFTGSEIMKEWALSNTQLGSIFSAGLIGMTIGAMFLAPFGDKIGRRNVFLIAISLITAGMLGIYGAQAYWQILLCRVITGLGIGGILPTMASATSEFSNNKTRDFNVGLIQGGWPLGAILTGFFINWAMPIYGWRYIFLIAGLISLAMLLAVYFFMPDSLAFLGKKQPKNAHNQINNLLEKMGHQGIESLPQKPNDETPTVPLKDLFAPEYKNSTIRLWLGIFFGFLTLYTLMSWVPNIAKEAGLPPDKATYVGIALNLGAFLGVVAMGLFISRFGSRKVILGFMLVAFTIMISYANLKLNFGLMFGLIFCIGFFVQGGFNAFFPTATRIYPSEMRSTGVGLAFGVGRFGAILGPQIFGILKDSGMSISSIFTLFSLPLLVTAYMAFTIPSKNLK
jgi:MFS transporter, AAHS family, 4-hydroxybenzoate transporter